MSQRGIHFANDWISEAIDRLGTSSEHPSAASVEDWITHLLADAESEGIARAEIEEGVGDLGRYIFSCLVDAATRNNG